jgi:HTH-type transcriptional regulator/antitoxin HigA
MQVPLIRSDDDHRAALAEIDTPWGAPEGTEEDDRLEALVALVENYETKRWPAPDDSSLDPIDILRFAIDELGHSEAELAKILGSRSRASEVLSRRRALTVAMIHDISKAWKLPAELLIKPYAVAKAVG